MEYPAKIHVRSKLHYFPLIKDRLNEAHLSLFRTTYFRPWLDITNGDISFCNRLFLEKIGNDVKIIDVLALIEDEEKFSKASDEDAIRLCLLLSLEVIFMGWELVLVIWIIESSCESDRWWTKVPEVIPQAVAWTRKAKIFKLEYFSELFHKKDSGQFHPDLRGRQKGQMNSSAYMKLAIECCVPKKRKYADVMRSPYSGLSETLNVPSMEQLANGLRIDIIFLSRDLEEWLSRSIVGRCKFPWCNDISIDRSFWHGSMPKFYANNAIYRVGWSNVKRIFIPINKPKRHWSLAMFHICSGIVTFYDIEKSNANHDKEFRSWYLKMRQSLEEKILVVLKETGVFEKKIIDPEKYKISFRHADDVPKQGGVFGDCGVFMCMFLYRLAYGIPLAVDDLVQAALSYHEKMIRFYFKHKMFYP
nr:phospholipase-like protein [Tanacetum cinerariifolium]